MTAFGIGQGGYTFNINPSVAGGDVSTSYTVRTAGYTNVFCQAVADPFCTTAVLPGGPCQKGVLEEGWPTVGLCYKPNMNTNKRRRQ